MTNKDKSRSLNKCFMVEFIDTSVDDATLLLCINQALTRFGLRPDGVRISKLHREPLKEDDGAKEDGEIMDWELGPRTQQGIKDKLEELRKQGRLRTPDPTPHGYRETKYSLALIWGYVESYCRELQMIDPDLLSVTLEIPIETVNKHLKALSEFPTKLLWVHEDLIDGVYYTKPTQGAIMRLTDQVALFPLGAPDVPSQPFTSAWDGTNEARLTKSASRRKAQYLRNKARKRVGVTLSKLLHSL